MAFAGPFSHVRGGARTLSLVNLYDVSEDGALMVLCGMRRRIRTVLGDGDEFATAADNVCINQFISRSTFVDYGVVE
jgi:hypothetical protein